MNNTTTPNGAELDISESSGPSDGPIYLCDFRVSVDGDWLCLKRLEEREQDCSSSMASSSGHAPLSPTTSSIGGSRPAEMAATPTEEDSCEAAAKSTAVAVKYPNYPFGSSKDRDPVTIEKSNLVNIMKLVIREVLESSLSFGRQLDSDFIPLQHFFVVLEHVLRHGFKPKKVLMGPKKDLWEMLQIVERMGSNAADPDAMEITASIKDLPTVSTNVGRARAWLRIALMQKKLADYIRNLVEHRNLRQVLNDFYEPKAALRTDESSTIIVGLLTSLDVVDCNLCLKEDELDGHQGVIDFSLYLRNTTMGSWVRPSGPEGSSASTAASIESSQRISALVDQKNYVEEHNRNLTTTVTTLQSKMENLTATNALMKEDLSMCQASLFKCQEENRRLRQLQECHQEPSMAADSSCSSSLASPTNTTSGATTSATNSKTGSSSDTSSSCGDGTGGLRRRSREELEKELKLQVSMKAEMEMAMKLLERDVHEKQDTIISLREQLEDIKHINLEMYTKLQEYQRSVELKIGIIDRLELKANEMADSLKKADSKCIDLSDDKQQLSKELSQALELLNVKLEAVDALNVELRIEKEWRQKLQAETMAEREKDMEARMEVARLRLLEEDYHVVKSDFKETKQQLIDSQRALEEMAGLFATTKLELDSLQDFTRQPEHNPLEQLDSNNLSGTAKEGTIWVDDSHVSICQNEACSKEFNIKRRKHHCRKCGGIFCDQCSGQKLPLTPASKPVRVCDNCRIILLNNGHEG